MTLGMARCDSWVIADVSLHTKISDQSELFRAPWIVSLGGGILPAVKKKCNFFFRSVPRMLVHIISYLVHRFIASLKPTRNIARIGMLVKIQGGWEDHLITYEFKA
jgi:hypothetical protein